jgi:4-carboxymuconolactone decarboxylase
MPRIKTISGKSDVSPEHHAVVESVEKIFGHIRGPFSVLLHSPKLAAHLAPLVTHFRDENSVEPRLRSIAIITAVREREAPYVWAAQVAAARRNGVSNEVIDLIRAKGDAGKLPAEERDIVSYVRQMLRNNKVDQATYDALGKRHSVQWMVDLTAAANYYAFVSGMVLPFDIPAPADGDKL